jgi:hypothetical protein
MRILAERAFLQTRFCNVQQRLATYCDCVCSPTPLNTLLYVYTTLNKQNVPQLLVVNVQLPSAPPELLNPT